MAVPSPACFPSPQKTTQKLLSLKGVGPETADSILLYAGQHPVFVVDAYTRRILGRHGISPPNAPYEEIRQLCENALSHEELHKLCNGKIAFAERRAPATHHLA